VTNSGDLVEVFDLSTRDNDFINGQNATVSYHASEPNAQANIDPLPTLYSSGSQIIYAALEDNVTGCRTVDTLELIVDPVPITTILNPLRVCDDDGDGFAEFTLTDRDTEALNGQTGLTVSYHTTQPEAEAGTPSIGPSYSNTIVNTEQIWVRLTNTAAGCHSIMPLNLVVVPLPVPQPVILAAECDDDNDGLLGCDVLADGGDDHDDEEIDYNCDEPVWDACPTENDCVSISNNNEECECECVAWSSDSEFASQCGVDNLCDIACGSGGWSVDVNCKHIHLEYNHIHNLHQPTNHLIHTQCHIDCQLHID
jgi:hypothetical protein